jgi:Phasin protein
MAAMDTGQEMGRDANALAAAFFNGPVVDVFMRTTESCSKACLAWHEEVLRFAAERMQRDSELGHALVNTHSWADAAKLQQEWAASTLRDYTNETTRLFEIAADAGSKITQVSASSAADAGQTMADATRSTTEAMADLADEVRSAAEPQPRSRGQRRGQPAE